MTVTRWAYLETSLTSRLHLKGPVLLLFSSVDKVG